MELTGKLIEEVLSQQSNIMWENCCSLERFLYGLPTCGGGYPNARTKSYIGHTPNGSFVRISRVSLKFFDMDTILNLHPDYRGPSVWYHILVSSNQDRHDHEKHVAEGMNKRMENLFWSACASYEKKQRALFLNSIQIALKQLKKYFA